MLVPSRIARRILPILLLCLWLAPAREVVALSLGQLDDFENGTTQSWRAGEPHPAPPKNVASGGPAGAGDHYLLLTSTGGSSAGSRLSAFNGAQWAGSYTAAGVTGIAMDVRNFGTTPLALRVALASATSGAISTLAIALPSASGWTSVVFPIAPADLTSLGGSVGTTLGAVVQLRLLHAAALGFPGEPIAASLGVDNIRAVPEPSLLAPVALGVLGLLRARGPYRA